MAVDVRRAGNDQHCRAGRHNRGNHRVGRWRYCLHRNRVCHTVYQRGARDPELQGGGRMASFFLRGFGGAGFRPRRPAEYTDGSDGARVFINKAAWAHRSDGTHRENRSYWPYWKNGSHGCKRSYGADRDLSELVVGFLRVQCQWLCLVL